MSRSPSVETRLLQILAGIAAVAVLGVLVLVPYRLYARDVRHAQVEAHRIAAVAHTALGYALLHGEDVADLANRLQGIADVEIQLRRVPPGEAEPAAVSQRARSELHGTDLTYTAAPILAPDGSTWLTTMDFDLSPMRRESVRLIIDLVLAVILGSAVFSAIVYLLIRRSLVQPLREITRTIAGIAAGQEHVQLPEFETREMSALAEAVQRACRARGVEV